MLKKPKYDKLQLAVKQYNKKWLAGHIKELDESGTRLMINNFLTDVLCFEPITEVRTEYMIKGTYADYVIQTKGQRNFLVEVKALSLTLSDKHLRQAVNYGANEGIEWALLTNGKCFQLYKILFNKPIESKLVFSIDLGDPLQLKKATDILQFLHKDSVTNKGLDILWNKTIATDAVNIAGLLYSPTVVNFLKKDLKGKYKWNFTEAEIEEALTVLIKSGVNIELVKPNRAKKERKKLAAAPALDIETKSQLEPIG